MSFNLKFDFNHIKPTEETADWVYYPKLLAEIPYEVIRSEIEPECRIYTNKLYGKVYEARRISCVVGQPAYGELRTIAWDSVNIVNQIRNYINQQLMPNYQISCREGEINIDSDVSYALAHIYRQGHDMIGFHADREAPYRPVVSVSFAPNGVQRKFRFRPIKDKSGYTKEFHLGHGDVLIMKSGCQLRYKHTIPEDKSIIQSRINLTFRYDDPKGRKDPTRTQQPINVNSKVLPKIKILPKINVLSKIKILSKTSILLSPTPELK